MSRTLLTCFGALALNLAGCSQGDVAPPEPGCVDYQNLPTSPPISFQQDIMPIFGLSCIASSCHDPTAKKAGLILGDPAACGPPGSSCYDPTAKWKYKFPGPIDPNVLSEVLTSLLASSMTVPGLPRVSPGKPEQSFLLDKITAQQNTKQYPVPCQKQDPGQAGVCGTDMPLGMTGGLCAPPPTGDPNKVRAIAQWVMAGAQNN